MSCLFVYTTFPSRDIAAEIAKSIIEQRLAACANISPGHEAVYRWEGKVETDTEVAVVFKTHGDSYQALEKAILERHPHECPCIIALPITAGYQPFLRWIADESNV